MKSKHTGVFDDQYSAARPVAGFAFECGFRVILPMKYGVKVVADVNGFVKFCRDLMNSISNVGTTPGRSMNQN